jgi:carboxyl-terminal processing protease
VKKIKSSFVIALVMASMAGSVHRSAAASPAHPTLTTVVATSAAPGDDETPRDKDGKRKKARNGDYPTDFKRNYKDLIAKPATMGFQPDESLYRTIYYKIHNNFVAEVPDTAIIKSIKKEVANYLTQAKLSTRSIDSLSDTQTAGDAYQKVQEITKGHGDPSLVGFATIWGLIEATRDNYSVLMTSDEYEKLKEQLQSASFGGIGIYIELDKEHGNQLTVYETVEGAPASKAGIEAGDQLLKVDGKTTQGVTLDAAQTMIRGLKGSDVVLTISRKGTIKDISVTRGEIHTISVSHKLFEGGVGYIRLRAFGADTADEVTKATNELIKEGAKSIILDLRNNGGGYIDAAVGVVGEFSHPESLVVYTIDRSGNHRDYVSGSTPGVTIPMVCMVNEYSASASEITAAALLDHHTAKIVGDHSFGKGSVQQLYALEGYKSGADAGPHLKLTIARFYSPNGDVIDHKGVEPDVTVDMEPKDVWSGKVDKLAGDIQLKKAVEMLGGKPVLVPETAH